jgi:hypothetical protein
VNIDRRTFNGLFVAVLAMATLGETHRKRTIAVLFDSNAS